MWDGNNCQIKNCDFNNNTATVGGGAIHIQSRDNIINNCSFKNNTAFGEGDPIENGGGAVWSCMNITNISNSKFEFNKAGYGGALEVLLILKTLFLLITQHSMVMVAVLI